MLRNQGTIDRTLGLDVSVALQYRPFCTQNVVINASAAALLPGQRLQGSSTTTGGSEIAVLDPRQRLLTF